MCEIGFRDCVSRRDLGEGCAAQATKCWLGEELLDRGMFTGLIEAKVVVDEYSQHYNWRRPPSIRAQDLHKPWYQQRGPVIPPIVTVAKERSQLWAQVRVSK